MVSIDNKYRYVSALLTIIVFAVALLWLLLTRLSFNLDDLVEWPPKPDGVELLLADEFVEVEMIPPIVQGGGSIEDDGAAPLPPPATDLVNQGEAAPVPAQVVTSTQESPVTAPPVVETPTTTGPSKEEIEAEKAKEKAQKEVAGRLNSNTFKSTPGATGTGDGVTGSGAGAGEGHSKHKGNGAWETDVKGRGIRNLRSVESFKPGTITIRISVDPAGKITVTNVDPGATVDSDTREKCVEAVRNATADPSNKSTDDTGVIRFIFK